MNRENALQDSNSKEKETTFQPAFIMRTAEKKDFLRILHVDDDQSLVEVSKKILTMENNFEIDAASSVDEALQKLKKQTYDAIVSDYDMPLKNGLDFLRELRQHQSDIPFILFTGKGREEVVVKALNLGADSYINKDGSPETVYCELAHAINKTVKRKKTEEAVRKSEERYRELANLLPEIGFEADLAGKITFINQRAFEKTGFTPEELEKGMNMLSFVVPEEREKAMENIKKRITGGDPGSVEYTLFRRNGTTYPAIVKTAPVISENKVIGLRGVIIDITERKKTEEAIIEREANCRNLIDGMNETAWVVDFNGNFVDVNDAAVKALGYSREELLLWGSKALTSI